MFKPIRNTVCILLLILAGCQGDHHFRIQGQMPDKTYEGEVIYLVPLEKAVKERVDSAIVVNGMFTIEGETDSNEIFIIRAKPLLRFTLQELLVVKEPGVLKVNIGNSSRTGGTALNDSLQKWKENKMMSDSLYYQLLGKYKAADITLQSGIKKKADSLNTANLDFNYRFVRNNLHNVVGKFVNKIMGESFSPEQQKNLNFK